MTYSNDLSKNEKTFLVVAVLFLGALAIYVNTPSKKDEKK